VRLTLAVDGRTATASTTDLDPTALRQLVERTLTSARSSRSTRPGPARPRRSRCRGRQPRPGHRRRTPDDRARLVKDFVDAGPDLRAAGFVDTATTETAFASTAGQRVAGASTRATSTASTRPQLGRQRPRDLVPPARPRRRGLRCPRRRPRAAQRDRGRPRARRYPVVLMPGGGGDHRHLPRLLRLQRQGPPRGRVVRRARRRSSSTRDHADRRPDRPAGDRAAVRRRGVAAPALPPRRGRGHPQPLPRPADREGRRGRDHRRRAPRRRGLRAPCPARSCCARDQRPGRDDRLGRARAAGHPVPLLPHPRPEVAGRHRPDPQRHVPDRGRRRSPARSATCASPSRSSPRSARGRWTPSAATTGSPPASSARA
jgi:hypothetical protein